MRRASRAGLEMQADGEAREEPRAERPGSRGGVRERLFEERVHLDVEHRELGSGPGEAQDRIRERMAAPPPREADGFAEGRVRAGGIAHAAQRLAEPRQCGEPRPLVVGDGQGREHTLEVTHRLLEGQESQRAYPGLAPVADGLRRVRRLCRFEEVVRQGGEPLLVRRPRRLEGLGDGSVEGAPRSGGEALVERLAQQCVRERVAPQRARDLPQQAEREGRAESLEESAGGLLQHEGQRSELERSAHHCGRLEQAERRRSQGLEALAQQLLRARRDGGTEPAVRGDPRASRRQQLRQLDHEERVPLRHRRARARRRRRRALARGDPSGAARPRRARDLRGARSFRGAARPRAAQPASRLPAARRRAAWRPRGAASSRARVPGTRGAEAIPRRPSAGRRSRGGGDGREPPRRARGRRGRRARSAPARGGRRAPERLRVRGAAGAPPRSPRRERPTPRPRSSRAPAPAGQ